MSVQQTRKFILNINYSKEINLDLLDDWLVSVLKIEIKNEDYSEILMESLIKRKLLFIRFLLQSVLLPCFDSGSVLKLEQDLKTPSKWIANVAIVNIDNIPKVCYEIIINFAIKNIYWMMQNSRTSKNIEKLYYSIEKEVINKLKGVSGSGKSTMPMLRVAHQQHIPFFHLGAGTYQLGCGIKSRQVSRSTTDLDSNIGAKMSNNKMLTSNLIRMAGLPAPINGVATTTQNAIDIANKIGWPIVVKPVDADRGEGVTISVKNNKQLKTAFKEALKFSKSKKIIIEKEVKGVAHRIFIANSKLLYVVKRLPKSIKGDGHKQLSMLIEEANNLIQNEPPWLREKIYPNDSEAISAMKKSGFSLNSVPKDGELVPLRMIESTASGGTPENLTDYIHPDNLDISLRAAKLFGLDVAGIDIITTDIKKPWHETGAIINEVNLAPLLGGGEISRSYLPAFFKQILDGDGRIPIYAVVGGNEAMNIAIKEQNSLIEKGMACFVSSNNVTITASKKGMILPFQSLYKRCKALLMNKKVGAIILVIQTDEFLYSGLPIDGIKNITENIVPLKNLPQDKVDALTRLLD